MVPLPINPPRMRDNVMLLIDITGLDEVVSR
jgi:hypothetical protein